MLNLSAALFNEIGSLSVSALVFVFISSSKPMIAHLQLQRKRDYASFLLGPIRISFLVAPTLRGITISDALLSRDPFSGTAYYASLILFALLPRLLPIHHKIS